MTNTPDPMTAAGMGHPQKDRFWINPKHSELVKAWIGSHHADGYRSNLLIVGPTGCGKTELLMRLGRAMNMPVYKVDCASMTTIERWVGRRELVPDGSTVRTTYVLSEHLRWVGAIERDPGIVLYDEITRLPPPMLNVLIPILDGSHRIWVPELDEYVNVHPQTMFAATANVGANFTGTYNLDVALADRFGIVLELTWPPAPQESQILILRTGITVEVAQNLVRLANQVRERAARGEVSGPISTRSLINCGLLIAAGLSPIQAITYAIANRYEEGSDERQAVLVMAEGIFA